MTPFRLALFAGHVGKDPGAIDPVGGDESDRLHTVEAVVTWGVVQHLQRYCTDVGVEHVVVVGNIPERIERSEGCTVGVEVHADVCANPRVWGHHVIYHQGSTAGQSLATAIDECLAPFGPRAMGPHAREDLAILRHTQFPCALVEVGFLSNPAEEAHLNRMTRQASLAFGILAGVLLWRHRNGW